jgi:CRISPR-associated protein Cas2
MWLMVMFDLPVETKENRRDYRRFVDKMEDDGYMRVQFSVFVRPCATDENTLVHQNRLIDWLPPEGEVRVLKFTDKQWGRMMVYRERSLTASERAPEQFTFFDSDGNVLVDEQHGPDVAHQGLLTLIDGRAAESYEREASPLKIVAETLTRLQKKAGKGSRKKKSAKDQNPTFDFFD